jgi:hypothetical protein
MLSINKKATEEKKKTHKRRKTLHNENATKLLQGLAMKKKAEEMIEDARLSIDRSVLEDAVTSPVEAGYLFPAEGGGKVVVDLRKPIAFSETKRQSAVNLGIDYDQTFPITATNPVLLWNLIERAGISEEAEALLKLIDNAVSSDEARTLLAHQAKEAKAVVDEFQGNAIDLIEKRELSADLSDLSYLKEVSLLSTPDREAYLTSIGINTTAKAGETTAEQKQTLNEYKERVLLV